MSQNSCNVEQFLLGDEGIWQILNPWTEMKQTLKLRSIDCEVLLSDIYYRVQFGNQET